MATSASAQLRLRVDALRWESVEAGRRTERSERLRRATMSGLFDGVEVVTNNWLWSTQRWVLPEASVCWWRSSGNQGTPNESCVETIALYSPDCHRLK